MRVEQTYSFAHKYLAQFVKGVDVSDTVELGMADAAPLSVLFPFEDGFLRYFLSPKIIDTDME